MTDDKSLADYVEIASKRHNDASGRRLAELAAAEGYDVSHNTINRIRKGTYQSIPTSATLQAIAHLAGVDEDEVFKAASADDETPWREFEKVFQEWRATKNRLFDQTVQFARIRGITVSAAGRELDELSRLYDDFMKGVGDWAPPWTASVFDQTETRSRHLSIAWRPFEPGDDTEVDFEIADADDLPVAARTAPPGYQKGRGDQDADDSAPDEEDEIRRRFAVFENPVESSEDNVEFGHGPGERRRGV